MIRKNGSERDADGQPRNRAFHLTRVSGRIGGDLQRDYSGRAGEPTRGGIPARMG